MPEDFPKIKMLKTTELALTFEMDEGGVSIILDTEENMQTWPH